MIRACFGTAAALLALALAAYLWVFDPATLAIDNAGWAIRGTDNGENALGLHAWLHDPGVSASPRTALLNAPDGVALLFTDSNPLLALAVRPFATVLPADAQLLGPWVLLCLFLNAAAAWWLLRRHAPGRLALWAGVVLLAFPPTLINRFLHVNLMAHWTILAALALFLDRRWRDRFAPWAGLIALTTLIHSYLLVMVAAIWASAWLRMAWHGEGARRILLLGQAAAMLALVAAIAMWLGVGGDMIAAGNYGLFAMPLDALWNPANSSYSNLLPAIPQPGGFGMEGFQYLGAGGLILIAVGAWGARSTAPRRQYVLLARLRWLAPAFVVLTLLAISHRPAFAGMVFGQLTLPDAVITALDPVRASGRLFWPVGYVLVLAALLGAYRLGRPVGGVLAAIVVLQLADTAGMSQAIRATSAEAAEHRLYARTTDPRWDGLVASARSIAFMPTDVTRDLAVFQEIAWRAVSRGIPVNTVYAARTGRATQARLVAEEAAFARGELIPGRLYVLLRGAPLPAAATVRMRTLDEITVIAPSSPPAASSPPGCGRAGGSAGRCPPPPRSGR